MPGRVAGNPASQAAFPGRVAPEKATVKMVQAKLLTRKPFLGDGSATALLYALLTPEPRRSFPKMSVHLLVSLAMPRRIDQMWSTKALGGVAADG